MAQPTPLNPAIVSGASAVPTPHAPVESRFLLWLPALLLLGTFVSIVVALLNQRAAAGKGMPAYSIYSEQRDGLGEAAYLLRQLGWVPEPLTRPVQEQLQHGLLILVEPAKDELTQADARHLLAWV